MSRPQCLNPIQSSHSFKRYSKRPKARKPEEIAPVGLQVDKEAEIAGTLTYRSSAEQADAIESSAVGEVVYEYVPPKEEPAPTFRHWFVKRLQTFLTLFVLDALVAWRAPILLSQLSHQARTKPLLAALWGLPAIPVIIIGVIALWALIAIAGTLLIVVTLGKLWLSTLLTGTAALALTLSLPALGVLYGTKLIVSYLVGKLILERLAPQIAERTIWPLMLGIVLYVIITSIPCLGHVIGFIVALIGLGAIWLLIRQSRSAPGEIPEEAAAEAIIEASPPVEE